MRSIVILLFSILAIACQGQNTIGIPDIINYPKDAYNAGTQNRGLVEDQNGVMYFANYDGLLSYDGVYWKLYPLPNKTVVRSVAIGKDNKIYVGGEDEFGYFTPDNNGKLTFTSLKPLLPGKNRPFSDIWFISILGNDVFFMCRERIFQLSSRTVSVYPAASKWLFMGESNGRLIAQDSRNGMLEFKNDIWTPFVKHSAFPSNYLVTCIFPFGSDSSFVGTVNTGFYILYQNNITPFHFQGANPFLNERVLTAIPITKDWLAIGTNLSGIYIVSKQGKIIQNFSRKEGLQNNNILKLFLDRSHNLWLGLDNGIDFIAYNNAIKHIYPEKLNEGSGYTSIVYKNVLYVGTSNGLYSLPITPKEDLSFSNGEFKPIAGTKGSTWGLSEINGKLLLGHHDGAFQITGERIDPITTATSFWTFLPYSNVFPSNIVLAGNDFGISMLQFQNGRFILKENIKGYTASSQFITVDNNNVIWSAHPYEGVYKIDLNSPDRPQVTLYTEKNGLPTYLKNRLFKVKNHIVAATEKGVFEYNPKLDVFEPSAYFKNFFGERNIRYLKEDYAGNIWFIEDNDVGVIDFSGSQPETIYFPELNGKIVTDYENIYPYNKCNVFIGAEKGFYHINYEEYKKNHYNVHVKIRNIRILGSGDSLLYGGYFKEIGESMNQSPDSIKKISNNWNSVHFEFSSPLYVAQNSIQYSYQLKGYDNNWSAWSKKTEKDYTNLSAGRYTFLVKAKSNRGNESETSVYSFIILPPWYQTPWAITAYILSFIAFNYLFFKWLRRLFVRQQQKHEEEQKRLQYLHQLEIEKSEKEIIKLRNEKLETEIGHKNKELASATMHLVQKGELLGNVREELKRFRKGSTGGEGPSDELKKMLKILNEEHKMDKDWDQFAIHFDNVHSDFLRIMKNHYPRINKHELKLSAYLRMNLSSKEIAQLENISVRGVEISRYRLRKKLNIPTETNLYDFLMALHANEKMIHHHNGNGIGKITQ
ncbi:MAG TPA: triple tyrosine motif-containing protein [Chitinophagaceae bacterium]|nr:triple tyrosine motif-containing protein [Chitinophagaceae bacterium]